MSTALSNAQCPYCDHVSPAGSKFCNDCGAALHLRPCPHCGAVNDITQNTHCSRCNGDLGLVEAAERPEDASAAEPPQPGDAIERSAPAAEPEFAATPGSAPFEKPKRSGYRAPLFALVVIAVLVASYFGLRSTPEPAPVKAALAPAPASVQTAVKPVPTANDDAAAADKAPAPTLAAEAAVSASYPAPSQEPLPMPAPAFAASLAKLSPPSAGPAPAAKRSASLPPAAPSAYQQAQPYNEGSRLRGPGEGLNLKPPSIGNCTDAVAALGLCTPEPSPRSP